MRKSDSIVINNIIYYYSLKEKRINNFHYYNVVVYSDNYGKYYQSKKYYFFGKKIAKFVPYTFEFDLNIKVDMFGHKYVDKKMLEYKIKEKISDFNK